MQPGQKTAGDFPNFFEGIYSSDVWGSIFGCRFEYLMVSQSYGFSKTDEALNLNNRNSALETMAITILIVLRTIPEGQIFTFQIVLAIVCPVSLVQDSMPLRFLCELKKFASVSSHSKSYGNTLEKFLYYATLCINGISFPGSKLVMKLKGGFIKRFYHLT